MIQFIYATTFTITIMFTMISHPLSLGLALLLQVTLISMITGLMSQNFWFSYILFMVMIGGMLVLFIYMTSVASNEKFLYSNKMMMITLPLLTFSMLIMFTDSFPMYTMTTNTDMNELISISMFNLSLSKYLNFPTYWIMIMMIIYLLITLIAVVKITNITYGPLRQKF